MSISAPPPPNQQTFPTGDSRGGPATGGLVIPPAGNLNSPPPSDAEVRRAVKDMTSALRQGGYEGMNAPYAVTQTFRNNEALMERIQKIALTSPESLTDEMKTFIQVMGMAGIVYDHLVENKDELIGRYGYDVTAVKAQTDTATLVKQMNYTSVDMYTDISVMVTSFLAEATIKQLDMAEEAVKQMKEAASKRYAAAMIQACTQIAGGVLTAGMALGSAYKSYQANKLDARIEGMEPGSVPGESKAQTIFNKMSLKMDSAGLHAKAGVFDAGAKSLPNLTGGIAESAAAGKTLAASEDDAEARQFEAYGGFFGSWGQSLSTLQSSIQQMMQAIVAANLANIQSGVDTQRKIIT